MLKKLNKRGGQVGVGVVIARVRGYSRVFMKTPKSKQEVQVNSIKNK